MGRLIEESKVLEILHTTWLNGTVAHRIIDEIKQRIKLEAPTVEAIPKDQYEARLKDDLAILEEIRTKIETKYGQCDICEYFEDYDYEENDISEYRPIGDIADILQIIDKYKYEMENI